MHQLHWYAENKHLKQVLEENRDWLLQSTMWVIWGIWNWNCVPTKSHVTRWCYPGTRTGECMLLKGIFFVL